MITTVMAVVLSEKANNDPDLISKVVEVLLLCLDTSDKYIIYDLSNKLQTCK